jgi:hypothetical protein
VDRHAVRRRIDVRERPAWWRSKTRPFGVMMPGWYWSGVMLQSDQFCRFFRTSVRRRATYASNFDGDPYIDSGIGRPALGTWARSRQASRVPLRPSRARRRPRPRRSCAGNFVGLAALPLARPGLFRNETPGGNAPSTCRPPPELSELVRAQPSRASIGRFERRGFRFDARQSPAAHRH